MRVLPAAGEQLLERLRAEGDQTEADLIVAADAGNLWRLQEAGLLQPVTSPALEAGVPARLHDPQGYWWGFSKRVRVIVYNKAAIDPATIVSMDDLASPRFRGQVCARSSTTRTERPSFDAWMAARRPAGPLPKTTRSYLVMLLSFVIGREIRGGVLALLQI